MIGKISIQIMDSLISYIKKREFRDILEREILEPSIYYLIDKLYPYFLITAGLFLLTFIVAIIILIMIIRR